MAEENKPQEAETPAPASGDKPTQEVKEVPKEIPKEQPKPAETVDYKAELEKEKALRQSVEDTKDKAERRIVKLKNKLDENNIAEDEEGGGISEDTLKEAVTSAVQDVVKPLQDRVEKAEGQLSEALRAGVAKANASPGGGEGGQKPQIAAKPPVLSIQDRTLISKYGLKWDANAINPDTNEKGVYTSKDGAVYPLNYQRQEEVRKVQKPETL